ncbi:calcium-binding protein [Phaeobacter gallaeciensis]|uniref:calcium-binding protein n=1 Tax=Phaeobacter gallaeciensis TaxID=60890 RepID=UPI000BBC9697|nr:calcium-binding protein [Phaeobacter gallaeciensis]ATF18191.1 Hemolysin-type calcium-binding protein repeat protein (2 copies) [Phaeobacter gallaeciensis]ATF22300.1 Hemolysin-type calcium-binding protein repeat protein (2 copies) [Phaeobacter gallaeciensis]
MAIFTVNDPTGTLSLNNLSDLGFDNASLNSRSVNQLFFTSPTGTSITLTGNFSASSPYLWTIESMEVRSDGIPVYAISEFSMNFYRFSVSSGGALEAAILTGDDTITSNMAEGNRWLAYGGDDVISLGVGNDYLNGGSGTDRMIVHDNFGRATVSSSYGIVTLESADGRDTLYSIEQLEFANRTFALRTDSSSSSTLSGDRDAQLSSDMMLGGRGNDTLSGLSGRDMLLGEDGSDHLLGGEGHDTLKGGDGQDVLLGGTGRDWLAGDLGNDTMVGGSHGDKLIGGGGNDNMRGQNGHDVLRGNSGWDSLLGGRGNDRLYGDGGQDRLIGQEGNDTLTGGTHADTFVFHRGYGTDIITDFTVGEDRIQIGRGADGMDDLTFSTQGADVQITFADVTILLENSTLAQIEDADNFLF